MKKVFAIFIGIISLCLFASCNNVEESNALTHAEYIATEKDATVTIEAYIQGKQSWWDNEGVGVASFYLQDQDGGYFVYNLPCTEEDYEKKLTIGTKIQVTGKKGEFAGEIEIDGSASGAEATYKVLNAKKFIANPKDLTDQLGKDMLAFQNMTVTFKNLTVLAQEDGTSAFYYKWDNSGKDGDDLYIIFSDGTNKLSAVVESYLCDKDSDVYKAIKGLTVGDTVTIEAFLYWYNGAQPHITKVVKN